MSVKKVVISIFLMVTLIIFNDSVFCSENPESSKTVRIGYIPNYGVLNEPLVVGKEGFGYEYFNEIKKYTNHKYKFIEVNFEESLELLDAGEIDLLGLAPYHPYFDSSYVLTERPFGFEDALIIAPIEADVYYGDLDTISDSSIGVMRDSSYYDSLKTYIAQENLNPELIPIHPNSNIADIYNGYYDFRLASSLYNGFGYQIVQRINQQPFSFLAKKENKSIIDEIDVAMKIIDSKNTLYDEELYLKYANDFKMAKTKLSAEEIASMREKDLYTIRLSKNHPPLSYIDSKGSVSGLAVDLMDSFSEIAGINIEYVALGVDEQIHDHCDINFCLVGSGIDRIGKISKPYGTLSMYAIKHKVLQINKLAVLDYNSSDVQKIQSIFPASEIILMDDMNKTQELFRNGEVDCMVASAPVIGAMLNDSTAQKYDFQALEIDFDLTFSVSNNLPDSTYETLNKMVQNVDKEFANTSLMHHSSILSNELTAIEFLQLYFLPIIIITFLVIFTFIGLFYLMTRKKHKEMQNLLDKDELTGLLTRRKFLESTKNILNNARTEEFLLIVLDIDNFKFINKTYGYAVGNEVLQLVGQKLYKRYSNNGLVARDNNDKFLVFTPTDTNDNDLCNDFNHLVDIGFFDFTVQINGGIYRITDINEDLDHMLDCAHSARIYAKKSVDSNTLEFTKDMRVNQIATQSIVSRIEYALNNDEFYPVLQPKYDFKTVEIVGAEALVRWKDKYGKILFPNDFIPIIEANGFITNIDLLMLEKVCKYISESELEIPRISVNISTISASNESIVEKYMDVLNKYGVSPSKIEFEITESSFLDNFDLINKRINDLKKLGFTISMDDFGSGISSFARLKDIDIDILKLDGAFISENLSTEKGIRIVETILALSKTLSLKSVAECVETEDQVKILKKLGCNIAQGYYYSTPLELEDFSNLLMNSAKNK